ncbi:MAG: UDP-N-acetylmuramoyl-L-alanine--D-glutamate ligase, partial [Vallitaleaceae bacterium]|nr:UDP-N-acetylmuramoyl-L-alanine--D-glutamate ligase [Vallitaleaceae bacterium]
IVWFSMTEKVDGVYYEDGKILIAWNGIHETFISMKDVFLFGKHNIENIMAALAMSLCMAVPMAVVRESVANFKGVAHRIEFVKEVSGVCFYNDSKATNPDSAIAAIVAMRTPTVLIGGGMDKGSTFDEWILAFGNKIKALILFGETKFLIEETAKKYNFKPVLLVNTLEEAVAQATKIAENGDSVLLSPACASWDMFVSYEHRGQLFKDLVLKL